jgi:hypothetical protein
MRPRGGGGMQQGQRRSASLTHPRSRATRDAEEIEKGIFYRDYEHFKEGKQQLEPPDVRCYWHHLAYRFEDLAFSYPLRDRKRRIMLVPSLLNCGRLV